MIDSMQSAAKIIQQILEVDYPQVRRAWIFGSYADNTQSAESDLAILVELDQTMGLEFISMIQELDEILQTPTHVLTLDQARELEKKYGYSILGKAKNIYERIA